MTTLKLISLFFVVIFLLSTPRLNAQEWQTAPRYGAVIDLGDLASEDFTYPEPEIFQQLAELDADTIMLQSEYLWTMQAPYEALPEQFELLEYSLNQAAAVGLSVIVSLRNGPGTNSMLDNIAETEIITALYTDPEALSAYQAMLQDLITRFGERPEIVAWEPLVEPNANRYLFANEPAPYTQGAEAWQKVASALIQAIREVDSERPILISPVNFASTDAFASLQKFDDDNIIYNLHFYDPYAYTHQTTEPYTGYPGMYYFEEVNKEVIATWLEPVDTFQAEHDVPIMVGEWGGMRWVPNIDLYYRDLIALFEERGWSWLYYAWYDGAWRQGGFEAQWGAERRNPIYDPQNPVFLPILEAWQTD